MKQMHQTNIQTTVVEDAIIKKVQKILTTTKIIELTLDYDNLFII